MQRGNQEDWMLNETDCKRGKQGEFSVCATYFYILGRDFSLRSVISGRASQGVSTLVVSIFFL